MGDQDIPKSPLSFLRWFCKSEVIDEVEGDLIEAYKQRAGMNPKKAKRKLWKEVLQSFNRRNIGIMNKYRDRSWYRQWSMIKQYTRVLFRTMKKTKVYTMISLASLVLGISCASLIYLYIHKELNFDQIFTKSDQIYRINHTSNRSDRTYAFAPLAMTPHLIESLDAVESGTRIFKYRRAIPVTVEHSQKSFNEPRFGWADPTFFELFDLEFVHGNRKNILDRPNTVVISETIARKYFGTADPIGKVLIFSWDEVNKIEVVGVYKDFPTNTSFQLDLISNLETCQRTMWGGRNQLDSWRNMFVSAYLLIDDGRVAQVEEVAQQAINENFESDQTNALIPDLQPLTSIHLGEPKDIGEWSAHNDMQSLILFGGIGAIILFLGCFNFINMVTAQAGQRAKEVGVRKVLGSHRKHIIQQTFFETVVFVILSGCLSVCLIYFMLPWLGGLTQHIYTLADVIQIGFLAPFLVILAIVALVSGAYPALYISRINSLSLMKKFNASDGGKSVRNVLVITQFSITTGLVICTFIVYLQLNFLHNKELGFDDSVIVNMPIHNDNAVIPKINAFKSVATTSAGISGVTAASHEMLSDYTYISNFEIEEVEEERVWERYTVEQSYISTFDLEIIAGRDFDPTISTDSSAFILNESAVRDLGIEPNEAINRSITDVGLEVSGKIIGVVKDFHFRSLHHEIQPFVMYVNWDRLDYISVRMASNNFQENIEYLEKSWYEVFGESVPFFYSFLDQQARDIYEKEANEMKLFSGFSIVSMALGALGLFGFILFTMERKFKEIGLRKVLGASTWEIILMINRNLIKIVGLSFLLAAPVAFFLMSGWLKDYAYRIEQPIWVYALTIVVTFLIATITVSYSSWKAASSNPVDAIKVE